MLIARSAFMFNLAMPPMRPKGLKRGICKQNIKAITIIFGVYIKYYHSNRSSKFICDWIINQNVFKEIFSMMGKVFRYILYYYTYIVDYTVECTLIVENK